MPVPSRINRAEAKYNITTDFPHLGLHAAASTGDVGLVRYALSHGQPVNSSLDGVLPLHVACSGGNEMVVKILIDSGADVNAPRLPRRYSDRNRDSSAPIVGVSGSTPLHFAAANGHSAIIRILLLRGAHADRPDKHGVTPEMLARQNGRWECADILREWLLTKDNDLKERGEFSADSDASSLTSKPSHNLASDGLESSLRKKLHLKRSIDHAFNALKSASSCDSEAKIPALPTTSPDSDTDNCPDPKPFGQYTFVPLSQDLSEEISARRPSLPHLYDDLPPSVSSRTRRPRSAGTGAESTSPPRKLSSKISLLNLFKKSNADGSSSSATSISEQTFSSPAAPAQVQQASPLSSSATRQLSPRHVPQSISSSQSEPHAYEGPRHRMGSSSATNQSSLTGDAHTLSREHSRARCASADSRTVLASNEDISQESPGYTSPSPRPGILRLHNRSSSSGQGPGLQASSRTLRFDSSSASPSPRNRTRSPPPHRSHVQQSQKDVLRPSRSTTSLRRVTTELDGMSSDHHTVPDSAPAMISSFDEDDENEDEYGDPITRSDDEAQQDSSGVEGDTSRGQSLPSSSSSLSPSPLRSAVTLTSPSEFPFSINAPPPEEDTIEQDLAVPPEPSSKDDRLRGESVSSQSTDSTNVPSISSYETLSTGSMPTPNTSYPSLPSPVIASTSSAPVFGGRSTNDLNAQARSTRYHFLPPDIDIQAISSHAQAEALVQLTQQSILDYPLESLTAGSGSSRSPLSARLAAYGESLAIEKHFKEQEANVGLESPQSHVTRSFDTTTDDERSGLGQKYLDKLSGVRGLPTFTTQDASANSSPRPGNRKNHQHHSKSDGLENVAISSEASSLTAPLASNSMTRSRTPDPESDLNYRDSLTYIPLSRVSTVPADCISGDRTMHRKGGKQARQMLSANKLTRMGFQPSDGWQPSNTPPRAAGHKHRFGGIRTLMQSFQSKA